MSEHRSEHGIIQRRCVVLRVIHRAGNPDTTPHAIFARNLVATQFSERHYIRPIILPLLFRGHAILFAEAHIHTNTLFIIAAWLCARQPVKLAKGSSLSIWPVAIRSRGNFISSTPSPFAAPRMPMIRCGQFGCAQSKLAVDRPAESHNCQP